MNRQQLPMDPVDLINEVLTKIELVQAKERKAQLQAEIGHLFLKLDAIEKQKLDWLVGWHLYNVLGAEKHPMFERCCEIELMRLVNMTFNEDVLEAMGETA